MKVKIVSTDGHTGCVHIIFENDRESGMNPIDTVTPTRTNAGGKQHNVHGASPSIKVPVTKRSAPLLRHGLPDRPQGKMRVIRASLRSIRMCSDRLVVSHK